IGTYGVLALVLSTGLRWLGYAEVSVAQLVAALVLSRAAMPPLMAALSHARTDGLSRSVGRPGIGPVAIALGLAALIGIGLTGAGAVVALLVGAGAALLMALLARAKIGGQTGDILGATQIVVEITVLITFIAL
ncbi:MAG: adenosylcobinamide-GDP ribazoletransferase, partial [Pseudomonadota bacterium]